MNYFLMIVMLFESHHMLFFMSKSHSHMSYSSNVRKAAHIYPAGDRVWGRHHLTTTSWLYKSGWGPFLHVIPHSFLSSTSRYSVNVKMPKNVWQMHTVLKLQLLRCWPIWMFQPRYAMCFETGILLVYQTNWQLTENHLFYGCFSCCWF